MCSEKQRKELREDPVALQFLVLAHTFLLGFPGTPACTLQWIPSRCFSEFGGQIFRHYKLKQASN